MKNENSVQSTFIERIGDSEGVLLFELAGVVTAQEIIDGCARAVEMMETYAHSVVHVIVRYGELDLLKLGEGNSPERGESILGIIDVAKKHLAKEKLGTIIFQGDDRRFNRITRMALHSTDKKIIHLVKGSNGDAIQKIDESRKLVPAL